MAEETSERRYKLKLEVGAEELAVVRLPPSATVPDWVRLSDASRLASGNSPPSLVSVTYTSEELSLVLPQRLVPPQLQDGNVESGWRSIKVSGTLDFALVGVLASLAVPLAQAGVSIFALSTYNTDYVLVKGNALENAARALTEQGHEIVYQTSLEERAPEQSA